MYCACDVTRGDVVVLFWVMVSMESVSFVGALSYSTVTVESPDIWYLQVSVRPSPRPPLRVVHVLDAVSSRTETCTVALGPMSLKESAGADPRGATAKSTIQDLCTARKIPGEIPDLIPPMVFVGQIPCPGYLVPGYFPRGALLQTSSCEIERVYT